MSPDMCVQTFLAKSRTQNSQQEWAKMSEWVNELILLTALTKWLPLVSTNLFTTWTFVKIVPLIHKVFGVFLLFLCVVGLLGYLWPTIQSTHFILHSWSHAIWLREQATLSCWISFSLKVLQWYHCCYQPLISILCSQVTRVLEVKTEWIQAQCTRTAYVVENKISWSRQDKNFLVCR